MLFLCGPLSMLGVVYTSYNAFKVRPLRVDTCPPALIPS